MENQEKVRTPEQNWTHGKLALITKALESTSDAIGISDAEGQLFYQNRAFSKLFDFETAEELKAVGGVSAIVRDKGVAGEILGNVMNGESWAGELTMMTKSGRFFPAFKRADAIRDDHGEIIGIIMVITDWTGRKLADSELSQSSEFLVNVINGIADPLFVKDEDHRWIVLNDSLCSLFGYSSAEMLGKSDYDFFPKEQADIFWAHDDKVMASDKVDINEEEITGAKGTHTISTIKSSFTNPATGRRNLVGTIRDITECKRVETLLRTQHDLTQALGAAEDLGEVLGLCIRFALKGSGMDCGAIYMVEEDGSFSLHSHSGFSQSFVNKAAWYAPDSPNTKLVLKGDPIFAHYDNFGLPVDKVRKQEGLQALGIIPIKHEHKVIGCLNVGSRKLDTVPKVAQSALITITSLMGQYIIRKQAEENLRKSEIQLAKRVKELNCLFGLSRLVETSGISMEEILVKCVGLIPDGWQYPDITCAKLMIEGREYKTDNYQSTVWRLSRDIVVSGRTLGSLDVCYLEKRPEADEGSFLKEEVDLIEAITESLQRVIERVRSEEDLRQSEEKHRLFFENSPLGMVHYSGKGVVTSVNCSAVNIFGSSREKLVGVDLISLPDKTFTKEIVRSLKGEQGHYEGLYTSHTGGMKSWIKADWFPILADGEVRSGFGILKDITDRKRAEETLLESEEKYRNFFENARIGIYRTRLSDGLFLEANQRLAEIIGYDSREELIGRLSATDFYVQPEKRSHEIAELTKKGEVRNCEGRFRKKDGSMGWARSSAKLYVEKGYIEGIVADITELKQADAEKARLEDQYRQAQKVEAIGRLAAGVAHDMNNLLTPILGFGEMLMTDFSPDDRRRRFVDQIVRAGYRSRNLVRQLLAFGRKQTLNYKPLNINKTIDGFEKLLRRTIRENIEIEILLTPDIQTIKADIGQIEQVLMNLSVNGQDAMPDGGRLTLETAMVEIDEKYAAVHSGVQAGRYVMLAVSDNGSGMDEETRKNIFEPFYSTKGVEGTGLGLATVYGIVKQHGGNIWVYSEPGSGTTFKLYLPVSKEAYVEKTAGEESTEDLRGSETILLVEDNAQVRDLTHAVLKEQGYTVLVAVNGAEALKFLASYDGPVHLLLTDVVMPGMNGKELFTRAADKLQDLKVLYMSGYTGNVIAQHGILNEGVQFIQKPFSIHGLTTKVREVLAQAYGKAVMP